MSTPKEDYLNVIKHTQLIALDLIIVNENNEVLLGYRNNNPAKHTWFTFGSRVFKDESFKEACERISCNEVGKMISLNNCVKHGVYYHNYTNNFDNDDFGTNYIVFAFVYKCDKEDFISIKNHDNQHNLFEWFSIEEIMNKNIENIHIHQNVKNYFLENAENRIF